MYRSNNNNKVIIQKSYTKMLSDSLLKEVRNNIIKLKK